jgi:formylmethanofuran dehydrogenase subunit E
MKGQMLQSRDLLKRVIEFHGHLGSFLILGLEAGLHANSLLGKRLFRDEFYCSDKAVSSHFVFC